MTISRAGNKHGFTLLEILAVVVLLSIIFATAMALFPSKQSQLRRSSYDLTRDIQSASTQSVYTGNIHRLFFDLSKNTYSIEAYDPPPKRPSGENPEALAKWEEEQRALDAMNPTERAARTRLTRGRFKKLKAIELPSSVHIKSFLNRREEDAKDLIFYPSGEADEALVVLSDGNDHYFSLEIDSLSGRVRSTTEEISEQKWKSTRAGE